MQIVSYKFSAESHRIEGGQIVDGSLELIEKYFSNASTLAARREAMAYYDTHLSLINDLFADEKRITELLYRFRLYYVIGDESRFCIRIDANFEDEVNKRYTRTGICSNLNKEVEIYTENGYDTGGEIQSIRLNPADEHIYLLLPDTAEQYRIELERIKSEAR